MQLGNHLGNVLVTISDRKKGIADPLNAALIKFFEPIMLSGTDYYPFGMPMRIGGDSSYRYGFNGKENDNEVKGGSGLQLDYGFRVYDSRIGKFLSEDPLTRSYPWYTPYQFAGKKPIAAIDLDGLEEKIVTLQQFSLPRLDVVLTVNKAPDPSTISLGPNPRIDKEVVAAALIKQAQLDNPGVTIPTNGQFVFLEYPDNPEKNAAAYNVEMYGKTHHFTVSPQILKLFYDELPKARVNLGLAAEALNLVGAGVMLKAEMKAASGELKAALNTSTKGASIVEEGYTRVGRWMSETEYKAMKATNKMQEGAGGQTFASTKGSDSFRSQAKKGTVYVEFDVPTNSLLEGGKLDDWVKTIGEGANNSMKNQLKKKGGKLNPEVKNISEIIEKKN